MFVWFQHAATLNSLWDKKSIPEPGEWFQYRCGVDNEVREIGMLASGHSFRDVTG